MTPTPRTAQAGGRTGARRSRLALAALVCVFLTGAGAGAMAAAMDSPQVAVAEEAGLYRVAARFEVSQPAAAVFAVLTDYEAIPRFMPDVKTSIVRERFPGGALVEQEAVARLMMFSRRVHLLLEVHADGDSIRFRDTSGRSFTRYEGAWRLATREGQAIVTYELSARPSFDVPEFLLKRLLKRDAHRMIGRLRAEIAARSAGLQPAS